MDDKLQALGWAQEHTGHSDLQVFLHPIDAERVAGGEYNGHPIRQTTGCTHGTALIFDRAAGRYLRKGRP